ncbi:MAG: glycosyltransferase [Candidatus Korarchaeota archaeon]
MKVSAAILSYNCERIVSRFLNSLFSQTRKPDEIIIIDSSSDNTYDILRKETENMDNVILVKSTRKPRGTLRRECVERATGEIIYFVDIDVVMHQKCLENILAKFTSDRIAGIAGNVYGLYTDTLVARMSHKIHKDKPHYATWNLAYRKSVLMEIGNFRDLHCGEDIDVAYRVLRKGYIIGYAPDAIVYHEHPRTISKFMKTKYDYGKYTAPLLLESSNVLKLTSGANAIKFLKNPVYILVYLLGAFSYLVGNIVGRNLYRRGLLTLK